MSRHRISVMIESEHPQHTAPEYKKECIEDRVRDACELIDSGHESRKEWLMIQKLNNVLMRKKKLSDKERNVLRMIQPVLEKYGAGSPHKVEQKAEYHTSTDSRRRK